VFNGDVIDDHDANRQRLIRLLQDAHAGELAAALAYRAHWHSLRHPDQRDEVRRIEAAEWHHRAEVADLLRHLNGRPRPRREVLMRITGRFFGALCFVTGWFGRMYAAGRLEGMNVSQYETALELARGLELAGWLPRLEAMLAEEERHEQWFGDQIRHHRLLPVARFFLGWSPPPAIATA
jgi:demethoxyubiquinone hydroxylase (CLK1/Coq7/Cat5 family)